MFQLIAPQFNANCELIHNHKNKPFIVFELNEEYRVVVKSIDSRWSEDMQSDKFVMFAPVCKQGSLSYEDVNTLNRENIDVRFTLYKPKGEQEMYLGVDKLMSLAGGVAVSSMIMMVNDFIFSQKTLHMALKHNDNEESSKTPESHFH